MKILYVWLGTRAGGYIQWSSTVAAVGGRLGKHYAKGGQITVNSVNAIYPGCDVQHRIAILHEV